MVNTKVATNEENATDVKFDVSLKKGDNWIEITLPLHTASEANGGVKKAYKNRKGKTVYKAEHWTEKHRRHRLQKGSVFLALRPHRKMLHLPCKITLTRYAPRALDRFDNLPMALKYILDAICEVITGDMRPGHADAHAGFEVTYKQVKSKNYGVKIKIENKDYHDDLSIRREKTRPFTAEMNHAD